jgi:molecular chaperone GrpE
MRERDDPEAAPTPSSAQEERVTEPAVTEPAVTEPAVTEPAEAEPAVTEPAEADPAERLAELEDRYLRLVAEFDNFRKRRQREMEDLARFCTEGLVAELVPVLDALDRAIASSEGIRDYQAFHDGVVLIMQQLSEVLRRGGVEREEPVGLPFDPSRHEALAALPHEEIEEDCVIQVVEPGYVLNGRVVRPAKVVISLGSPASQGEGV